MALIVITDKPGQAGNQLWAFVNIIALARGLDKKIIITLEDSFFELFKQPVSAGVTIITKQHIIYKPWSFFLRFVRFHHDKKWWGKFFQLLGMKFTQGLLESSALQNSVQKRGILFLESWPNREHKNFQMLGENEIRSFFVFKDIVTTKVDELISNIQEKYDLIIGVHIRRGDYKDFQNGRYYYNDEVYLDKIRQIQKMLPGKRVAFLLCSNEKLSFDLLHFESAFQLKDANGMEDMYALSCCDYLIGPPSTFSMWASYYGGKPLKFIGMPDDQIILTDFKQVIAQDVFAKC